MSTNQLSGVWYVETLDIGTFTTSSSFLVNANVAANAAVATSKLVNRVLAKHSVGDGTTVAVTAGDGVPIYACNKTNGATIKSIEVVCPDAPSGGDLTFTVDLLKANTGAGAATVLSSVVTYPNGTADYTQRPGSISSASLADGDTLLIQIAVSGSTGIQGQGLLVNVEIDEAGT
jgi:hypothetical protein